MNKDILKLKKELKNGIGKKAVSTILAGSLIFGSGSLTSKVEAKYFLRAPECTYEDFKREDIKIFINGRNVEFNDFYGHPYIENGTTMIPLRLVAETFGAYVEYNSSLKIVSIYKNENKVDVRVDSNKLRKRLETGEYKTYTANANSKIINGRTYVPLRKVFELFGMEVIWDQQNKTAHIKTLEKDLNMIDFKDKQLINLNDVDLNNVNKVYFDEVDIEKDYINVLKNTDQYKAFIENNTLKIYSYQFLRDINTVYEKGKVFETLPKVNVINLGIVNNNLKEFADYFLGATLYERSANYTFKEIDNKNIDYYGRDEISENDYNAYRKVLKEYADEINRTCKTDMEKVKKAIELIALNTRYSNYSSERDGHSDLYNAYVRHIAVCQGYAASVKALMDELKIPCLKVTGFRYKESFGNLHMWNEIYVDGKWLKVDTTGSSDLVNHEYAEDFIIKDYTNTYIVVEKEMEDLEQIKLTYRFN